ncbi:MAG: formate dehydrogenase accessory sulfurtransferase FdhD [Saprospiraceae bacterium]|nr:formate dehydrogenase accessory sulfurtransferase FdhD [Saprospiraceae bacterium]
MKSTVLSGVKNCDILKVEQGYATAQQDVLAVEEPLEIQLVHGPAAQRRRQSIAVTMRTPGHDFDLALGFLFTEGIIGRAEDVTLMRYAAEQLDPESQTNIVSVELRPGVAVDTAQLSRHFYTASSCGVCGKASIDMVQTDICYQLLPQAPVLDSRVLHGLPAALSEGQDVFSCTGGLHAAGLFDADGRLLLLREDVGRHNAVDKLVGAAMQQDDLPLSNCLLLVSGRAGFELVQKALMAGIPVLTAVGAPSSLAVELAEAYGMTLIGFLRDRRFNVYSGKQRINLPS